MDRDDALAAFVAAVNAVEPDHARRHDPWPITPDDVDFGVTRSYYARCGPSTRLGKVVTYKTRMTHIRGLCREQHLALLVHEMTHITQTFERKSPGHPKQFWCDMAFHALELRDGLEDGTLEPVFGDVDVDEYLERIAKNPKSSTVDRRQWTVEECKDEMRRLVGLE